MTYMYVVDFQKEYAHCTFHDCQQTHLLRAAEKVQLQKKYNFLYILYNQQVLLSNQEKLNPISKTQSIGGSTFSRKMFSGNNRQFLILTLQQFIFKIYTDPQTIIANNQLKIKQQQSRQRGGQCTTCLQQTYFQGEKSHNSGI